MLYTTTAFIIMLTVFISYVSFIWAKYGVQKSISASYYCLPDKWKLLMTLFCWGFAVPAIIIGNSLIMFMAGAGIAFVGGAAAFAADKMIRDVHMIGAGTGVFFSQLAIWLQFGMWPINLVFIGASLLLLAFDKKTYFWWIEILAFLSIVLVYALTLF